LGGGIVETGFLDRSLSVRGKTLKYQIFVPENWSPERAWPVILFLHGAGERGSDGLLQTDGGLPQAIRQNRSRFPTIVIIPQCQPDYWWPMEAMEKLALDALSSAMKEFNGDNKRLYLTGLSMGGFGSWHFAARYKQKFAAVVPICGGVAVSAQLRKAFPELRNAPTRDGAEVYAEMAKKIGRTPVWIFHGAKDDVVPVEYSRKMNKALKAAGGNARYTEYRGVGHNSWDKAYAEPELMPWLLSKTLP
jgi:predicted peptidase